MRYRKPDITQGIVSLKEHGCIEILVFPLYPQYAAATSASAYDKIFETLRAIRWQPAVRFVPPYFDDRTYIDILATSLRAGVSRLGFVPDAILVSFHGLPKSVIAKGDPYNDQCLETWRLLCEELHLSGSSCPVSFQSRFGSREWLQPYTAAKVKSLASQRTKAWSSLRLGFPPIASKRFTRSVSKPARFFSKTAARTLLYIPCLNDSELGMMLIYELVARELEGWI